VTVDESLPGPWNTYLRGKSIEGEREEEKEKGRWEGCVQFPRWIRNGMRIGG